MKTIFAESIFGKYQIEINEKEETVLVKDVRTMKQVNLSLSDFNYANSHQALVDEFGWGCRIINEEVIKFRSEFENNPYSLDADNLV